MPPSAAAGLGVSNHFFTPRIGSLVSLARQPLVAKTWTKKAAHSLRSFAVNRVRSAHADATAFHLRTAPPPPKPSPFIRQESTLSWASARFARRDARYRTAAATAPQLHHRRHRTTAATAPLPRRNRRRPPTFHRSPPTTGMRVALLSVGDELLAGDTANTNTTWLGARLTERGATVDRSVVVPDRIDEIADTIADLHERYDAVLVTGGLGPTHDDLTMDAVAQAFDRKLETNDDAVAWLETHRDYERADLAENTAKLPTDARIIHNEVGVAPGCVVESVYVFPRSEERRGGREWSPASAGGQWRRR